MRVSQKDRLQQRPWFDRGWYLVTEFEKTSSINFQRALKLAQTHPDFIQLMDERNIIIYRNIYREQDLLQFRELYKLIKNWKGRRLYFKGDEVEYETIESGIRCYIQTKLAPHYDKTPAGNMSCETFTHLRLETSSTLGCIGCRRSNVSMEWRVSETNDRPCWFFFGKLDRYQVYRLNKEELKQTVLGHLFEYHACPLLDLEYIAASIERFPVRIDPRKDKEWEYVRSQQTGIPVRYHKLPDVAPTSEDAYRMYLKRTLQ